MKFVSFAIAITPLIGAFSVLPAYSRRAGRALFMQDFSIKDTKKEIGAKMDKSIEAIQNQFNSLRAGQANPAMLDRVQVDYYGSYTPLNHVARVSTQGASMLLVEPYEKSILKDCEKAIITAELNLNPVNDGSGCVACQSFFGSLYWHFN